VGLQAADFLAVVAFLAVLVVPLRVAALAVSVKAPVVKAVAAVNVVADEVVASPSFDERGPSLVDCFAINYFQTEHGIAHFPFGSNLKVLLLP